MTVAEVAISGFRSIRSIRFPLRRLTVLVGGNGVGKTNLYRSLELLQAAAKGTLSDEIAREGGLGSIFWAGGKNLTPDGSFDPMHRSDGFRNGESNRLKLEVTLEGLGDGRNGQSFDPTYQVELGFPPGTKLEPAPFPLEAEVKAETLSLGRGGRSALMERNGRAVWGRDAQSKRVLLDDLTLPSETALAGLRGGYPEIDAVRVALANWRFFHGFRTDAEAKLRRPCQAVTSPLLASDGGNLAAVFATLRYVRQETIDLDMAIESAFPGARLVVPRPQTNASFSMVFPDVPKRAFEAHELSDGTLQFLALLGALLSYRLPPFIALNEPETSLHPSLLPALAQTIAKASERAQVWVVTHSRELAGALATETGVLPRDVIRKEGVTWLKGLSQIGTFADD